MSVTITLEEGTSRIKTDELLPTRVYQDMGYFDTNYKYTWRYKNEAWNGWEYLLKNGKFPTGLFETLFKSLIKYDIHPHIINNLLDVPPIDMDLYNKICSELSLRDYQKKALYDILQKKNGLIRAPTGTGKTRIGLASGKYFVEKGEDVAIMVPTIPILKQWQKRAQTLGMDVGYLKGGTQYKDGNIVIISIQKASRQLPTELALKFHNKGILIVDENHLWGASTYYNTTSHHFGTVNRKYGMTATLFRTDNREILYEAVMGSPIVNISYSKMIDEGWIVAPNIRFARLEHGIELSRWELRHWNGKADRKGGRHKAIIDNIERNKMIAEFTQDLIREKRPTIVFVDIEEHARILQDHYGLDKLPLIWSGDKLRFDLLDDFTDGVIPAVIGTTMIDVGVDIPCASGAVMAGGGKSPVRYYQRIGRLLRPFPNPEENTKENALVYDFCDNIHRVVHDHAIARARIVCDEKSFKVNTDSDGFSRIVDGINKVVR